MRLVSFEVLPVRDGVMSSARVAIERHERSGWMVDREWNVVAGEVDATRRLLLHDDERLIIEAVPNTELVYDKEHNLVSVVRKKEVEEDGE